jgi:hypothetical protein
MPAIRANGCHLSTAPKPIKAVGSPKLLFMPGAGLHRALVVGYQSHLVHSICI